MTQEQLHGTVGVVGLGTMAIRVNTAIVYDRKDGRILHTHVFATIGSATPPTEKSMEQAALKFVTPQGGGHHNLAVLHHGEKPLKPHTAYRVDVATSRLVEVKT